MKELEKDMTMLRAGMKEVGREIEFYRGQPVQHGDRSVFIFGVQFCQPVQHGDRSTSREIDRRLSVCLYFLFCYFLKEGMFTVQKMCMHSK